MDNPTDGLSAVFLANKAMLLRFASARLSGSGDDEDVLQDVWLKISELRTSGPITDPLAYLFRMTENAVRDRQRSEARRRAREAKWMDQALGPGGENADTISPEKIAIEKDRLRRVESRIAGLPERTRQIFRAVRLEKRRQPDIAQELGISLSAVEKHLQRAYKTVVEACREDDAELEE